MSEAAAAYFRDDGLQPILELQIYSIARDVISPMRAILKDNLARERDLLP